MAKEYHIVYGEQAKAVLEESGSVDFSKRNVELILLQDNFNEGKLYDLKTLEGLDNRIQWFEDVYGEDIWGNHRRDNAKDCTLLLKKIQDYDQVYIWLGNDSSEYVWQAVVIDFLKHVNAEFFVIDWSDIVFYDIKSEVISSYSVSVSSLPNIKIASQNFRLLKHEEKNEFSDLWIKLLKNNAELRVLNTSNEIEEADITYYDKVLMSNCKSDFQPSFKVIGLTFCDLYNGFNSCGIGDMFLMERLKQLCYEGKLKMRNQEHGQRNGNIFEVALNNKQMSDFNLKKFLDKKVQEYNQPNFIPNDPICIPHLFTQRQDIEIMGFIASILAWGQRKTIINKCKELIERMGGRPYDFIMNHKEEDLKTLLGFKHRTFNDTDLLYFVAFFKYHYSRFDSLEDAFLIGQENVKPKNISIEKSLDEFKNYFFSLPDYPYRTRKHVSSPAQKSTCKRLNMFLRWMVRVDEKGVDFGIWNRIAPSQLICPCDVHVERVARKFHLMTLEKLKWKAAVELTENLLLLDAKDPVKYDFALFGLGVEREM